MIQLGGKYCTVLLYSKVQTGNNFPNNCPSQTGLKQGNSFSQLLFNFALKYAIMKVKENMMGLK
jgi:hypothetical protein